MVSVIIIDTTKLGDISNDIFSSKINFEKVITKCIFEEQYKYNNDICQFEIILPDNLTKEQRHIIHKYSKANELYTQTFSNEDSNRQLSLFLSKKYIQKLLLQYALELKNSETSDDSKESNDSEKSHTVTSDTVTSDISSNTSTTNINENNNEKNIKKYNKSNIYENNIVCFMYGFICGICANALVFKIKQD